MAFNTSVMKGHTLVRNGMSRERIEELKPNLVRNPLKISESGKESEIRNKKVKQSFRPSKNALKDSC